MAEYSLGTAKGRVIIDYDDKGLKIAADDFERTEGKARKAGKGFSDAGTKLAVAGGVIAAGLGLAANTAIQFEKQISAIGAVSGATRKELEQLRTKALQIGQDTSFSATEAASAMEELAKAGVSVTDIMNGAADATVALAAAGGVELPQAAELAADAMNAFSLKAQELPKIADLIAGAANSSSISVGDFGQSLKQVGAVANLAGLSFRDTATAIALLGQQGIKGSDAGTSLKTMLSNLIPVTDKQKTLFKELGLLTKEGSSAFFDMKGNVKGLADISQILQNATKGMTSEQKQLTLETIFGSDAIRAAAVLTKAGAAGFNEMAAAMDKTSAADVAAARLNNTAGAIERLKGSAETVAISLGTILLPMITKLAKFLDEAATKFNGLSDSTKNIIVNVALVTSGLLLFLGLAVKIFQFAQAVKTMVVALRLVTAATQIWSVVTKAAAVVWRLLNLAFVGSPIGLIVVAILALVAGIILLWKHSETFRKIVLAVWDAIKKAALAVVNWFKEKAIPFFKAAWDKITSFFAAAWKVIQVILNAILAYIKFWVNIVTSILKFLAPVFKAVFGLIASVVKTAWTIISAILSVIVAVFKAIFGLIFTIVKTELELVLGVVKAVWGFIGPYIIAAVKLFWDFIQMVWSALVTATKFVFNLIKDIITAVWAVIGPVVIAAVQKIWDFIVKAWDVIKAATELVWNGIKAFFGALWDGIVALFTNARDRVIAVIEGIKVIVDKVRNFFSQLKAAADQGIGPLIKFVSEIPRKILDAIGNIGSLLFSKGKELVQGLIDGILSMLGKLKDAAGKLVGAIGRFLPGSPAEEGPLSGKGYVLRRGQRFVDDFAAGILGAAKTARDAISSMMTGAVGSLPVNAASSVSTAQAGIATISVTTPSAASLAAQATNTSTVTIQNLNINGTWDMADPSVPRQFVAKLHTELDRYAKEHR